MFTYLIATHTNEYIIILYLFECSLLFPILPLVCYLLTAIGSVLVFFSWFSNRLEFNVFDIFFSHNKIVCHYQSHTSYFILQSANYWLFAYPIRKGKKRLFFCWNQIESVRILLKFKMCVEKKGKREKREKID